MPAVGGLTRASVGRVGEFTEGECKMVEIEGREIGVYLVEGEFYAIRNRCPHRFAPLCKGTLGGTFMPSEPGELNYGMENHVLRCPRHGWEFDIRTGEALFGVDMRKATTYKVDVDGDEVFVSVRTAVAAGASS